MNKFLIILLCSGLMFGCDQPGTGNARDILSAIRETCTDLSGANLFSRDGMVKTDVTSKHLDRFLLMNPEYPAGDVAELKRDLAMSIQQVRLMAGAKRASEQFERALDPYGSDSSELPSGIPTSVEYRSACIDALVDGMSTVE